MHNNRHAKHERSYSGWCQRVGGLTGVGELLRALNLDATALLADVGIAPDALDDTENRISYAAFGRLLKTARDRANYPHFGLTAGRMWHLEDLGLLGGLVRHSANVGEALTMLQRYQYLNGDGGLVFASRQGPLVEIGYTVIYPGVAGIDQIYDFALAAMFNVLRELCGPAWLPTQVLIPHAMREGLLHHRNLFKVVPQFDSEICALRFPAHWLDRQLEGADPDRRNALLAVACASDEPDLLQQVVHALRRVLLNGRSSGNEVAGALSMHRRTLNRRLQECGTTFQQMLDETRCEAARQMLCYSGVALDDIAASLGYAGVGPFMRSFRRWTGLTPGRLRRLGLEGPNDVSALMVGARHFRSGGVEPSRDRFAYELGNAVPAPVN